MAELVPAAAQEGANLVIRSVEALAGVLLVVLGTMLLASTVLRYAGHGEPRLAELTRVVFVYLIGLAAIAAYARHENIVVPGIWKPGSALYQLACTLLSGAVLWLAVRYVAFIGWDRDPMSLMKLPEATSSLPIVLFAAGLLAISLLRLVAALRR
ncbi:MAG: hypothetical protein KJZ85_02860 [Rhodobacteraceae bacterium]|jgi:TRAP-type C4-dicarboxylate transport system permease small subunit|nr:hypothetical protein [Paracoccaceae bacterium]